MLLILGFGCEYIGYSISTFWDKLCCRSFITYTSAIDKSICKLQDYEMERNYNMIYTNIISITNHLYCNNTNDMDTTKHMTKVKRPLTTMT